MESDNEFRYDVFISYSHKDEKWVRNWLVPNLESCGVSVCIDFRDFEPGAPSLNEMERAVQTSYKTLLVITPYFVESEWTEFESIMARTLDPAARERRVIPLMLKKVELPLRLSTLTYISFFNSEIRETQFQRLVKAIGKERTGLVRSRILIIEDKESWINIIKEVFADCDVDETRTAVDGISKLESCKHYDIVLVNMNLTVFDEASGQDVLEYIRDRHPSLPRIVITGKPIRGPVHSTLFDGYGITEFFTKADINIPELRQLVHRILAPLHSGPTEYHNRKSELVDQLRQHYDNAVSNLNEGLKALNIYEIRLRREVGQHQAEELTNPDRNTLLQKRENYKKKYDSLFSRIAIATESNVLLDIEKELADGW